MMPDDALGLVVVFQRPWPTDRSFPADNRKINRFPSFITIQAATRAEYYPPGRRITTFFERKEL